jgi:FkbM family methyltransferase
MVDSRPSGRDGVQPLGRLLFAREEPIRESPFIIDVDDTMTLIASDLQEIFIEDKGISRAFTFRPASDGDREVIDQMFYQRDYDLSRFERGSNIHALYENIIKSKRTPLIIDAGANIGASIVFFALKFPSCRIIAIEPELNNCILLRKNCVGLNYQLIEGGVACENGTAFLADIGHGDMGFMLSEHGDYLVSVYSLDAILKNELQSGATPLIVKIDIEGGEADLFRASTAWLAHVPLVIIELHDWMLPGKGISRNFLRAVTEHDFDVVHHGENTFCFNNAILRDFDNPNT